MEAVAGLGAAELGAAVGSVEPRTALPLLWTLLIFAEPGDGELPLQLLKGVKKAHRGCAIGPPM